MNVTEVASVARKTPRRASLRRKPIRRASKPKKRTTGRNKPKGVSKLMRELDTIFSRYVRLKNADGEGMVLCYTCCYRAHYKKMQNGHYLSRFYKKYRYDERNCRVQCSMCNMWKNGDIATFRMKLVAELGAQEVESMENDYKELYKLTVPFLEETLAHYQEAVENLSRED